METQPQPPAYVLAKLLLSYNGRGEYLCDRDHVAHRAEIVYSLALSGKSVPTHVIEDSSFNITYTHQSIKILL